MIGDHIKHLREARGLSLTELAERADVAKSYLSAIERKLQGNPSIDVLTRIASVLGVSVQTLILEQPENSETLDEDWVNLAREAMKSGVTKEQFREYLEFQRWRVRHEGE